MAFDCSGISVGAAVLCWTDVRLAGEVCGGTVNVPPLTLSELWNRTVELFFLAFKLILQGLFCFARIFAIHVRFVGMHVSNGIVRASEWVDDWQPVRMR